MDAEINHVDHLYYKEASVENFLKATLSLGPDLMGLDLAVPGQAELQLTFA